MSKVRGYPHHQSFNVSPRRNLTKKRAWWQVGKTNNRSHGKRED
jgi:hypothetical protein